MTHFILRHMDPQGPQGVLSTACVSYPDHDGTDILFTRVNHGDMIAFTTASDQTLMVPTDTVVSILTYDPEATPPDGDRQQHTAQTLDAAPVGTVAWEDDGTTWIKTHAAPPEWFSPVRDLVTTDMTPYTLYTAPWKDNQ